MKRNADAPAVRRRPDQYRADARNRKRSKDGVGPRQTEIDEDDDGGDRKPIADDREEPGIALVSLEHQPAVRATVDMLPPAGKKRSLTAVGATLSPPTGERFTDHRAQVYRNRERWGSSRHRCSCLRS